MDDGEMELEVRWVFQAFGQGEGFEWSMQIRSLRAVIRSTRLYKTAKSARWAGCRAIKTLHPTWRIG